MLNSSFVLLFLIVFIESNHGALSSSFGIENIDDVNYKKMPKLFKFDDYRKCLPPRGRFSDKFVPQYCVLSVELEGPRNNTKLFEYIKSFSANSKQHFNHVELKRGICMQSCFETHEKLGEDFRKYKNEDSEMMSDPNDPSGGMANIYNKLCNVCINKNLMDKYGLVAKTSVDYCVMKDEKLPLDHLDLVFVGCSVLILILIALSALLARNKNPNALQNFKRTKKLLNAFDVRDNLKKLMSNSNDVSSVYNTKLQALKVLIMFLFVIAQTYRHIASMPFMNPSYVEKSYHSFWIHFFDMEIVTSLFLVVCGIQTSIFLIPEIQKSQNNWQLLRKIVTLKFDKLVTLFSAFVLFNATILAKLATGPFWKGAVSKDLINCRNGWRMNLLTVNNYAANESICIEPSWILSCEFHLMIVGFVSLYLMNKFPRAQKIIAVLLIAIPFSIYVRNLNQITFTSPEILRKSQVTIRQTHFNSLEFIFGLLGGFLTVNPETNKLIASVKNSTFFVSFVVYVSLSFVIKSFVPLETLSLTSVLGAYMKFHHGIFLSFFICRFVFEENFKVCNQKLFAIAEKMFSVTFLTSLVVTKLAISSSKVFIELSLLTVLTYSAIILISSYAIAFGLSLVLEIPIAKWQLKEIAIEKVEDVSDKKKAE